MQYAELEELRLLNYLLSDRGLTAHPPIDNPTFDYEQVKKVFGVTAITGAVHSLSCDKVIQEPKNDIIDWKTLEKLLPVVGQYRYSCVIKYFINHIYKVRQLREEKEKLKSDNVAKKNINTNIHINIDEADTCVHALELRVQLERQKNLSVILDMLSKQIITVEDAKKFIL